MTISIDPLTAGATLLMLIVLALIAWWQLRNMGKTGRAALLDQLNTRWSSPPIKKARRALFPMIRAVEEKHKSTKGAAQRKTRIREECGKQLETIKDTDVETYNKIQDMWSFFETMGYLAKRNYIKKEDVIEIYAGPIIKAWEASQDHINDNKPEMGTEQDKGAKLMEHFAWLANEAAKYLIRHHTGT